MSMKTRVIAMLALLTTLITAAWFFLPRATPPLEIGAVAPSFSLPDLQNKMHTITKGEVILLNFWATWCPPCRQEMPSLVALSNKLASNGLKVIAVSIDRDKDSLVGFTHEYELPFLVLHDEHSLTAMQYGVYRYPESYLINKQGELVKHYIGAIDWMSPTIIQEVEVLLK
ncbi:MAG: TlpA disulfide reductase family protein [Mariprofundales bacterium]